MSDTSQGQGWWQASDGKWYAPEFYPKDWPKSNAATQELSASADSGVSTADDARAVESVGERPIVDWPEIAAFDDVAAVSAPVADRPPAKAKFQPTQLPTEAERTEPGNQTSQPSSADPQAGEPTTPEDASGVDPAGRPTVVQSVVTPPFMLDADDPSTRDSWRTWGANEAQTGPPSQWDIAADSPTAGDGALDDDEAGDSPTGSLGLLGSSLLIIGSFLTWASAGGTLTAGTVNGLSGSNGWGTLIAGLVLGLTAGMVFAGLRSLWLAAALAVSSLTALALAVFSYVDIGNTSDDLPGLLASEGVPAEIANGAVLDINVGLWVVILGAVVGLIAAAMSVIRRPEPE